MAKVYKGYEKGAEFALAHIKANNIKPPSRIGIGSKFIIKSETLISDIN